uniref:Salivary thrombin inhibitor XC-42 n=1 Tax=Xenopsylla cheopis TaxID=163159 RepID=XC42_XENCH|nr:putative secreted salivary protein [Xenopsylla cheopis]
MKLQFLFIFIAFCVMLFAQIATAKPVEAEVAQSNLDECEVEAEVAQPKLYQRGEGGNGMEPIPEDVLNEALNA